MLFADLEARMNSAISDRLSNVEADIDGVLVPGYFRASYADEFGGLTSGRNMTFGCLESLVTEMTQGDIITINDANYTVTAIEPDGTGNTLLQLRLG
jgi:hypothetical protein